MLIPLLLPRAHGEREGDAEQQPSSGIAAEAQVGPMLTRWRPELARLAARGLVAPAIRRSTPLAFMLCRWTRMHAHPARARPLGAYHSACVDPTGDSGGEWRGKPARAIYWGLRDPSQPVLTGLLRPRRPARAVQPGAGQRPVALTVLRLRRSTSAISSSSSPQRTSARSWPRSSCWAKRAAAPRAPAPRRHRARRPPLGLAQREWHQLGVALVGALGQRMVDQDAPHHQRRHPQEVTAAATACASVRSSAARPRAPARGAERGPVSRATSARRRSGANLVEALAQGVVGKANWVGWLVWLREVGRGHEKFWHAP